MKYEIYCDESCVEALFNKEAHPYAVIGGIWIPAECRQQIKDEIKKIRIKYGKLGEMKWKKVSPVTLDMYKELIDLFFGRYQIRFRAICIKASEVDHETYNQGSGELGFYKFYFQLIHHWLVPGNEYSVFIDYKTNADPHRATVMQRVLRCTSPVKVDQVQALSSEQSLLIQLADVLTGVVAASFNNDLKGTKLELANIVEQYLRHPIRSTGLGEQKFNVFDINLRKGW